MSIIQDVQYLDTIGSEEIFVYKIGKPNLKSGTPFYKSKKLKKKDVD